MIKRQLLVSVMADPPCTLLRPFFCTTVDSAASPADPISLAPTVQPNSPGGTPPEDDSAAQINAKPDESPSPQLAASADDPQSTADTRAPPDPDGGSDDFPSAHAALANAMKGSAAPGDAEVAHGCYHDTHTARAGTRPTGLTAHGAPGAAPDTIQLMLDSHAAGADWQGMAARSGTAASSVSREWAGESMVRFTMLQGGASPAGARADACVPAHARARSVDGGSPYRVRFDGDTSPRSRSTDRTADVHEAWSQAELSGDLTAVGAAAGVYAGAAVCQQEGCAVSQGGNEVAGRTAGDAQTSISARMDVEAQTSMGAPEETAGGKEGTSIDWRVRSASSGVAGETLAQRAMEAQTPACMQSDAAAQTTLPLTVERAISAAAEAAASPEPQCSDAGVGTGLELMAVDREVVETQDSEQQASLPCTVERAVSAASEAAEPECADAGVLTGPELMPFEQEAAETQELQQQTSLPHTVERAVSAASEAVEPECTDAGVLTGPELMPFEREAAETQELQQQTSLPHTVQRAVSAASEAVEPECADAGVLTGPELMPFEREAAETQERQQQTEPETPDARWAMITAAAIAAAVTLVKAEQPPEPATETTAAVFAVEAQTSSCMHEDSAAQTSLPLMVERAASAASEAASTECMSVGVGTGLELMACGGDRVAADTQETHQQTDLGGIEAGTSTGAAAAQVDAATSPDPAVEVAAERQNVEAQTVTCMHVDLAAQTSLPHTMERYVEAIAEAVSRGTDPQAIASAADAQTSVCVHEDLAVQTSLPHMLERAVSAAAEAAAPAAPECVSVGVCTGTELLTGDREAAETLECQQRPQAGALMAALPRHVPAVALADAATSPEAAACLSVEAQTVTCMHADLAAQTSGPCTMERAVEAVAEAVSQGTVPPPAATADVEVGTGMDLLAGYWAVREVQDSEQQTEGEGLGGAAWVDESTRGGLGPRGVQPAAGASAAAAALHTTLFPAASPERIALDTGILAGAAAALAGPLRTQAAVAAAAADAPATAGVAGDGAVRGHVCPSIEDPTRERHPAAPPQVGAAGGWLADAAGTDNAVTRGMHEQSHAEADLVGPPPCMRAAHVPHAAPSADQMHEARSFGGSGTGSHTLTWNFSAGEGGSSELLDRASDGAGSSAAWQARSRPCASAEHDIDAAQAAAVDGEARRAQAAGGASAGTSGRGSDSVEGPQGRGALHAVRCAVVLHPG